jgi:hypothetical protein
MHSADGPSSKRIAVYSFGIILVDDGEAKAVKAN